MTLQMAKERLNSRTAQESTGFNIGQLQEGVHLLVLPSKQSPDDFVREVEKEVSSLEMKLDLKYNSR